jgi:hypothetical protein
MKASRVITDTIINQGEASLGLVENLGTRAKSSDTLSTYLKAMHIDNTI